MGLGFDLRVHPVKLFELRVTFSPIPIEIRLAPDLLTFLRVLCRVPPPRPGPAVIAAHRQRIEGTMIGFDYDLTLPAPALPADVATRELTATVNGVPTVTQLAGSATAFTLAGVPVNATIDIVLVDIDASGNRSAPSPPLDFTAVDDVPPDVPGAVSVAAHRQVVLPDAQQAVGT